MGVLKDEQKSTVFPESKDRSRRLVGEVKTKVKELAKVKIKELIIFKRNTRS